MSELSVAPCAAAAAASGLAAKGCEPGGIAGLDWLLRLAGFLAIGSSIRQDYRRGANPGAVRPPRARQSVPRSSTAPATRIGGRAHRARMGRAVPNGAWTRPP